VAFLVFFCLQTAIFPYIIEHIILVHTGKQDSCDICTPFLKKRSTVYFWSSSAFLFVKGHLLLLERKYVIPERDIALFLIMFFSQYSCWREYSMCTTHSQRNCILFQRNVGYRKGFCFESLRHCPTRMLPSSQTDSAPFASQCCKHFNHMLVKEDHTAFKIRYSIWEILFWYWCNVISDLPCMKEMLHMLQISSNVRLRSFEK
jgi:hypothetical protein